MEVMVMLDFADTFSRVVIIGKELQCLECGRRIMDLSFNPLFTNLILNLAKHEHGTES